jgi:hypothetical protein
LWALGAVLDGRLPTWSAGVIGVASSTATLVLLRPA